MRHQTTSQKGQLPMPDQEKPKRLKILIYSSKANRL
jgi:hypothetical protein